MLLLYLNCIYVHEITFTNAQSDIYTLKVDVSLSKALDLIREIFESFDACEFKQTAISAQQ